MVSVRETDSNLFTLRNSPSLIAHSSETALSVYLSRRDFPVHSSSCPHELAGDSRRRSFLQGTQMGVGSGLEKHGNLCWSSTLYCGLPGASRTSRPWLTVFLLEVVVANGNMKSLSVSKRSFFFFFSYRGTNLTCE